MSSNGKGSNRRPQQITQQQFAKNWAQVFSKPIDNTGTHKNEYQDILSTEDCILDAFEPKLPLV